MLVKKKFHQEIIHANKKTNDRTHITNHYRQQSLYVCNDTNDLIVIDCPITSKAISQGKVNDFIGAFVTDKVYLATHNMKITRISNNTEKINYLNNLQKYNNSRACPKQEIDLVDLSIYNFLGKEYKINKKPLIESNVTMD